MSKESPYPQDVFISLQDLLKMEHHARNFSFQARKQKVRSILGGVVHDCLRHRLFLSYEANAEGITADHVIDELLKLVAVVG